MSKPDRPIADRATPELQEWLETVDRNATQKTVLAGAANPAAFFFRRGSRCSATGGLFLFLLFCAGQWSDCGGGRCESTALAAVADVEAHAGAGEGGGEIERARLTDAPRHVHLGRVAKLW